MSLKKINLATLVVSVILITATATLATSYYYIDIENKRIRLYNAQVEKVNQLSRHNAKWIEALGETKSNDLIDFDRIALYTKNIRIQIAELDNSGMLDPNIVGEATTDEYVNFKNMFELKYEAIQRYKFEKAILRNSANFLEKSANDSLSVVADNNIKKQISDSAAFLKNFLTFNNTHWSDKASSQLQSLESMDFNKENDLAQSNLATFINHGKVIIEYTPRVIEMFETAESVNVYSITKDVSFAYLGQQDKGTDRVDFWKNIMKATAVVSILAFLWLLMGLWKKPARAALVTNKS